MNTYRAIRFAAITLVTFAVCLGITRGISKGSHLAVTPASAVHSTCPANADRCYRTGAGRVGLAILGGTGLASTNIAGYDYTGAAEWWFQNGNLYMFSKKGWVGGEICLVSGTHKRWVMSCLTRELLARLIALAAR